MRSGELPLFSEANALMTLALSKGLRPRAIEILPDRTFRIVLEPGTKADTPPIDTVKCFLEECTVAGKHDRTRAMELYRAYEAWAGNMGTPAMTVTAFGSHLSRLGFTACKASSGHRVRLGIRLRDRPILDLQPLRFSGAGGRVNEAPRSGRRENDG